MKLSHIAFCLIALFFAVELLVGKEDGVISTLQSNAKKPTPPERQPDKIVQPVADNTFLAAKYQGPWDINEESLSFEAEDATDRELVRHENSEEQTSTGHLQAQPQPGSPEFPYVPLPKPKLTVAGSLIYYPTTAER